MEILNNDIEKAIKIAQAFVEKLNREHTFHPNYYYSINIPPTEYFELWYFDFKIMSNQNLPKDQVKEFAGAPGFVIKKETEEIEIIAWWQKHLLDEQQGKKEKLNKILLKIEENNWNAALVRKLTGIKPRDIFNLKSEVQSLDLTNIKNRYAVIRMIEKLMIDESIK